MKKTRVNASRTVSIKTEDHLDPGPTGVVGLPSAALCQVLSALQLPHSLHWSPSSQLRLVCKALRQQVDSITGPACLLIKLPGTEDELQQIITSTLYTQWLTTCTNLSLTAPEQAAQPQHLSACVSRILAEAGTGCPLQVLSLHRDIELLEGLLDLSSVPQLSQFRTPPPQAWGSPHLALRPLSSLSLLTHLVLDPAPATSACLRALTRLQHLTHLGLVGKPMGCVHTQNSKIQVEDLAALPHLLHLDLAHVYILFERVTAQGGRYNPNPEQLSMVYMQGVKAGWRCLRLHNVSCARHIALFPPTLTTLLMTCLQEGRLNEVEQDVLEELATHKPELLLGLQALHVPTSLDSYQISKVSPALRTLSIPMLWTMCELRDMPQFAPNLEHLHVGLSWASGGPELGDLVTVLDQDHPAHNLRLPTSLKSFSLLHATDLQQVTYRDDILTAWRTPFLPHFHEYVYGATGMQPLHPLQPLDLTTWLHRLPLISLQRLVVQGMHTDMVCTPHTAGDSTHSWPATADSSSPSSSSTQHLTAHDDASPSTSSREQEQGPRLRNVWLIMHSISQDALSHIPRLPALQRLTRLVLISVKGFEWRSAGGKTWANLSALTHLQDLQLGCFRFASQVVDVMSKVPPSCPSLRHLVLRLHADNQAGPVQQQQLEAARAQLLAAQPSFCVQVLYMWQAARPDVWPPEEQDEIAGAGWRA